MIKIKGFFFSGFPGTEESSFPHLLDDSKDWSPESPDTPCPRPQRVHSCTQTEAPQLPPAGCTEVSGLQPVPAPPAAPALTSFPSPVLWRKERHCAKWENREEESKPTYECLESVSVGTVSPPPHAPPPPAADHSALICLLSGQRQVAQSERDTTCEAEGGGVGGGDAEDAAEEAGPPPCGGGLLLIDTYSTPYVLWKAGAAPLWQDF